MFPRFFSLMMLSAAPLLAELSYFPAQPARLTPGELLGYKCEIMELLDYDPGRPDLAKRARALELIRENKNDCVNDRAGHDGIEYTPLYVACQRRDAELVQALLTQGADANHPRLQKLQGRLTPEIETLLQNARSKQLASTVSPAEWERRYHERIGGKLFWSGNKTSCAAATQNPDGSVEIWCLKANTRGEYIPMGVCMVLAPGFDVDTVQLHRGMMKCTLRKPGIEIKAYLHYQFFNYTQYDFRQSFTAPACKDHLEHPVAELPMYTKLVNLVES